MEAQIAQFANRGMNQDISVSKASNEFAFRNYNIRITAVNDNTLLSVTNEKLPLKIDTTIKGYPANIIEGSYLGHAILNDTLVLFTHSDRQDWIWKFEYKDGELNGRILYGGQLGFDLNHPIETLAYYENKDIQKVYWVDGINQPRYINIARAYYNPDPNYNFQFDFNPKVYDFPEVEITKNHSGGMFPSGVIQYFISYYTKYGAETGIVWASDLQYLSNSDKANSPDQTVDCSFTFKINNLNSDSNFYDHIRLYSIYRTSKDGEVVAQIVKDFNITGKKEIEITDNNTHNSIIDPTMLFYLGGDNFIASTFAQKDDTLFLGNIKTTNTTLHEDVEKLLKVGTSNGNYYTAPFVFFEEKSIGSVSNEYKEEYQLNNSESTFKTFKCGEWYRFALQFQDRNSFWTTPIWVGDKKCEIRPSIKEGKINVANAVVRLPDDVYKIIAKHYINYRLLIAEATINDRNILAQGIVSPTVFNYQDRVTGNGPFAISSWITRPRNGKAAYEHLFGLGNDVIPDGDTPIFMSLDTCEIQNMINTPPFVTEGSTNMGYLLSFVFNSDDSSFFYLFKANENDTNNSVINITEENIESGELVRTTSSRDLKHETKEIIEFTKAKLNLSDIGITEDVLYSYIKECLDNHDSYKDYTLIPNTNNWVSGYFYHNYKGDEKTNNGKRSSSYYCGCYTYIRHEDINPEEFYPKNNGYYIDNSILTFHSPELNNIKTFDSSNAKLKIVGLVPIDTVKSDIDLVVNPSGIKEDSGLIKWALETNKVFTNAPLFRDYAWKDINNVINIDKRYTADYYLYLWNKSESVIGQTQDYKSDKEVNKEFQELEFEYAELQNKIIANYKKSSNSIYYDNKVLNNPFALNDVVLFDSDQVVSKKINIRDRNKYYQGNYESIMSSNIEDVENNNFSYRVFFKNKYGKIKYIDTPQYSPVSIKYKSTPHLVLELGYKQILPRLSSNGESDWRLGLSNFYIDESDNITNGNSKILWFNENIETAYNQRSVSDITCNHPYLYLCEIVNEKPYHSLYGGTDANSLELLRWIPASNSYPIVEHITLSYGDTYYQRWDCLKTYPFTKEDKNSVIDITSFMVETHINLNGRYDNFTDNDNLLAVDNTNFNKINDVYSQQNNFFTYNVLDEKYKNTDYINQIAFSLQKHPGEDIDTWTSINLLSAFNINGEYGKLNKIVNFNDNLITFQDKAISVINFNNRTALSVEEGLPIEIANSGKVNGYNVITSTTGCQNKWSICNAASGVYFIDDYNKSFMMFNKEGLNNISSNGMSMWFKENLTGKERVYYDNITGDVYLNNDSISLVYNEGLQSFTSFMQYNNNVIFNLNGESFIIDENTNIHKMFEGEYTSDYAVEYKVNPEMYSDKIFTNIEYSADCLPFYKPIDSIPRDKRFNKLNLPFDRLEVWNEYQYGITDIKDRFKYPNFESKFRKWRVDIPRDIHSKNKLGKFRNPWIYLKLSNSTNHTDKMVFHNLLVKYYK